MEERITSNSERFVTTLVNDVEHIESQSLNGIAVVKIFFQPNANIQTALAQTTAIIADDFAAVAAGLHSAAGRDLFGLHRARHPDRLSSATRSASKLLFDFGNNFIRTQLATVRGVALPFPYGGKQRQIQVDLDSQALQSKGLSPVDVVNAVNAQNLILPDRHRQTRHARIHRRNERQPANHRRAERFAGQNRQRRHDLYARRRARSRRLLAADQHRPRQRPARRAHVRL